MLKKLFLSVFAQVVVADWRYAIDKRSCKGDMFDQVKYYMGAAQGQSQLVVDALVPYIDDPNNKPQDRILAHMRQLFKSDDVETARILRGFFEKIPKYDFQDVDIWEDAYRQQRDNGDLEIFCSADYVKSDPNNPEKNINWRDTAQEVPVPDKDDILDLKDPEDSTMAVTRDSKPLMDGQEFPEHSPETITFHPRYIKKHTEKNTILNSDRVKKAVSPTLRDKIKTLVPGLPFSPVDILSTPELTMLHELTHLVAVADALDADGKRSYGWLNCLRIQSFLNADSLAYFALVVDLIQNYAYDVDDKGKLNKIT